MKTATRIITTLLFASFLAACSMGASPRRKFARQGWIPLPPGGGNGPSLPKPGN